MGIIPEARRKYLRKQKQQLQIVCNQIQAQGRYHHIGMGIIPEARRKYLRNKSSNCNQIQAQGLQVISHWEPTQSKESDTTVQWQQLQYNSKKYRADQHFFYLTAYEPTSQGLGPSRKLEMHMNPQVNDSERQGNLK